MYPNLASFIHALESAGELVRVRAKVDPVLEIAQIADVVSKSRAPREPSTSAQRNDPRFYMNGGPALLFENVEGAKFPLLINAWGSYSRMEMALGLAGADGMRPPRRGNPPEADGFEALAARIASLTKPQPPRSLGELIAKGKEFLPLLRIPPQRKSGRGACQEVVLQGDQVDLTQLPILRCWPHDGDFEAVGYPAGVNDNIPGVRTDREWMARYRGRYITLAGIHTIHADDIDEEKPSSHNIGMYRVQMFSQRTLSMHWHMHHDGARHWRSWKAKGQRMPVAIVLGGESIMPYAATAPLPPGISELLLAGFLNGKGIPMVRGVTVPLWVPANAEIVIEGYVSHEAGLIGWDPRGGKESELEGRNHGQTPAPEGRATIGPGAVFEGPFGDHTGFYSMPDRYPLLEVTAITHRRNAVYPTTIVGLPPQEDYYLGKATERIFFPLLKTIVHDIEDYDLPMFGAFHNCACIKIKKAYPLQGRRVMHSVWGAGQMAWTKCVIVVDDDVDVHDTMQVMRTVGERCHPTRDVEFVRGPVDILDHAAPHLGASQKMGLDATRKKGDAELHQHVEGIAAELCRTGPLPAVTGDAARAAERRIAEIPGVVAARVADGASELAGWWLFIKIDKQQPADGQRVIKALGGLADEISLPVWTIVVGEDCDIANADDVFFHWLAQGAFERDRYVSVCGRRVAFDATAKRAGDERNGYPVRAWPPILKMSEDVVAKVQQRWAEYGIPRS